MKAKRLITVLSIVLSINLFSSCDKSVPPDEDMNRLREENVKLRKENNALKKELEELKKTPDFIYREGVDLMNEKKFENAKDKFLIIVNKYPNSEYESVAKERLKKVNEEIAILEEEKRIAEKEAEEKKKFEPRTDEGAIAEWKKFRNNEKSSIGTVTTWRLTIYMVGLNSNPHGYLGGSIQNPKAIILPPDGFSTYGEASAAGAVPKIVEHDRVCVTGRFDRISSNSSVLLTPIRIINEGYR